MNRFLLALYCAAICCGTLLADSPGENLLKNGGFESGTEGWNPFWTRDEGAGKLTLDTAERHGGTQSARIEHTGQHDWSLAHSLILKVHPGEIFELSAWVRFQGAGNAMLGVVTRDATGTAIDWVYGGQLTRETKGWSLLRSRFIIPPGIVTINPRLIGEGPATVWCDDFTLTGQGSLDALRAPGLPEALALHNTTLDVTFHTRDATFSITDHRSKRTWNQRASGAQMIVLDAKPATAAAAQNTINLQLLDPLTMAKITATARLDPATPELVISLQGSGKMETLLAWPAPFASEKGQLLILPVNEGISYPVDDPSLSPAHCILYSGHGLCMPWYGATDGGPGWMAIVETPDDASVDVPRSGGLLSLVPEWQPQKQQFGPQRTIRYIFSDTGGYVAMAKRYREYAKQTGLFKTLEEKRKANPAVDLLVGAVNIWCWDPAAAAWCRELQALGITHILWSSALPPDQIKALNAMGVLTSRYDIYQDTMDPANFPKLKWLHPDWTTDAWKNHDLMIGADGDWVRGWEIEAKDGSMIPCGTLCDREALPYAQKRIPADLATHPYKCRFIDTTTASPWRECYNPRHPMTRSDSKHYKMELLRYVSEGCGLVCGSETGHDAAVPYVDYFEGMLSLGPYRIPDAGRDMARIWDEVPDKVAKFQTGHAYRIPLWELVYHDCVIAQWYWGDYNNKLPKLWDRRDLWNALYGTPPMFMFDRKIWDANKARFVQSYQTAEPVARATAYSEMLTHEWLTHDHAIQRTRFANGVTVTVNFGDTPWSSPEGLTLPALGYHIDGLKQQ
ncbi:MAG: glycoside hydrolase [Chthoniobacteraceae bacterium]